ncbi:MAG: hypothetical protein KM310_06880 [Clostridiales bacterium]|nr:hypothetical protein [Clostridiales bacterium]
MTAMEGVFPMAKVVGVRVRLDGFGRLVVPTMFRRELGLKGRDGVVEIFLVEEENGRRAFLIRALREGEEDS